MPAIKFVDKPGYTDRTTKGSSIVSISTLPPPRQHVVVVLEADVPLVRLYNASNFKLIHDIDLTAAYAGGVAAAKFAPLCTTMCTPTNTLIVSSSDHFITMWDAAADWKYKNSLSAREPQAALVTMGSYTLFGASLVSPSVTMYDLRRCERVKSFSPHMDMVSCLYIIPGTPLLLTGCGDKTVGIIDTTTLKRSATLRGHKRAVRSMLYLPEWLLLLTAAFEAEVYGWQLSNQRHSVTLRGHSAAVVCMDRMHLPNASSPKPQVLTLDERGIYKIWDLGSASSGFATCLFTFDVPLPLSIMRGTAMAFLPTTFGIATGKERLHNLVPVPMKDGQDPPIRALWNPVIQVFVTVAGQCFRVRVCACSCRMCAEFQA